MIIVDTSVWIDYINNIENAHTAKLNCLIENKADLAITALIYVEILQGIRNDSEYNELKLTLRSLIVRPNETLPVYDKAVELYRKARKSGKTIRKTVDCIIAAEVISLECSLLHKDKDFDLIDELAKYIVALKT